MAKVQLKPPQPDVETIQRVESSRNWESKEIFSLQQTICFDSFISRERLQTVKLLGQGSFAAVYLCKLHQSDGKTIAVALKKLRDDVVMSERDMEDFYLEAAVLRQLEHSCIVKFVGYGTEKTSTKDSSERIFIVSEYMAGGTIKQLLVEQMVNSNRKLYSNKDALRWCLQIARGLKYLHAATPMIIHRDLKLDNIFLTVGGSVSKRDAKIGDLGLHMRVGSGSRYLTKSTTDIAPRGSLYETHTTEPMCSKELIKVSVVQPSAASMPGHTSYELSHCTGSLLYMAPEVYQGQTYNEKVDVFSFSIMMYELFTRNLIALGIDSNDELMQHVENVSLLGYRPDIPPWVPLPIKSLIEDCWQQDPMNRPSMTVVVMKLKQYEEQISGGEEQISGGVTPDKTGVTPDKTAVGCQCTIM